MEMMGLKELSPWLGKRYREEQDRCHGQGHNIEFGWGNEDSKPESWDDGYCPNGPYPRLQFKKFLVTVLRITQSWLYWRSCWLYAKYMESEDEEKPKLENMKTENNNKDEEDLEEYLELEEEEK